MLSTTAMLKRVSFLYTLICIFQPPVSFSQSLRLNETVALERLMYYFFTNNGPHSERDIPKYMQGRPSESFFFFLDIDSNGKVENVHLLSDDKNKDSAFALFTKMKPLDFEKWSCEKCGGKTIMIPINIAGSRGNDPPKYAVNLQWSNAIRPGEERNLIIIRRLNLGWPRVSHYTQGQ